FLHDYAVKYRDRVEEIRARRQEWIDAVDHLMIQLGKWLREADQEKVLQIDEEERPLAEERLGRYDTTQLKVTLGGRQVLIRSMGRNTTARTDLEQAKELKTQGRIQLTDGSSNYTLYRLQQDGSRHWGNLYP